MTYLLPFIILLTGCATFEPPMPERRSMLITIEPRATDLPNGIDGTATWGGLSCHIRLREYPRLLGHEVRHCFEGQWHGAQPNGSDW